MAGGGNAIRGSRVGAGPMGEAERGEAAPRQNVTYFCSHEHRTLIAFAVEAHGPGHLGLPPLRPPGEPGLRQPAAGPEDRALQDPPGLREGAPLRRRGQGHPQRGHRHPPRPPQERRRHLLTRRPGGWCTLYGAERGISARRTASSGGSMYAGWPWPVDSASADPRDFIHPARMDDRGSTKRDLSWAPAARCRSTRRSPPPRRATSGSLGGPSRSWCATGLVRCVLRGVYAAAQAPNDPLMRAAALALVLPPDAVVVDRTAAWLHGVDVAAAKRRTCSAATRRRPRRPTRGMNRPEVDGRRRGLLPATSPRCTAIRVTTALRTALDLGRLLWRFDALAAIDGFVGIGVPQELLSPSSTGSGATAASSSCDTWLHSPTAEPSPVRSRPCRLHWYDAGLADRSASGGSTRTTGAPLFRIDLADPAARYGAEYDGEEFHTLDEDTEHDEERRDWLERTEAGRSTRSRKDPVFSKPGIVPELLQAGHAEAVRSISLWTPTPTYMNVPLGVLGRAPTPRSACSACTNPPLGVLAACTRTPRSARSEAGGGGRRRATRWRWRR